MVSEALLHALAERDLSVGEFKQVVLRLLDKQVIYRRESMIESELYDLYVRMEAIVNEYLGIIGIRVVHHGDLNYIIAYPPGSSIPGVYTEEGCEQALQRRIHIEEAGLLITFRLLYEEKIREGEIDEHGAAYVSLETVFTRYHSIMKREMPSAESERRSLFYTLRRLRIITYNDLATPDQWIGIREVILHFTLEGMIHAVDTTETEGEDIPEPQQDEA